CRCRCSPGSCCSWRAGPPPPPRWRPPGRCSSSGAAARSTCWGRSPMSARRGWLLAGLALLAGGCAEPAPAPSGGFAGLGRESEGFARVVPGKAFAFPADHGAHPDFRIEWWYLTANLRDAEGRDYGVQWTLFRNALRPAADTAGWGN